MLLRSMTFGCSVWLVFAAAALGAEFSKDLASLEASLSKRLGDGAQALGPSHAWADACGDVCKLWVLLRAEWPQGPSDARGRLAYYRFRSWAHTCAKAAPKGRDAERDELSKLARGAELYLQAGEGEEFWHKLLDEAAGKIKAGDHAKAQALLSDLPDLPSEALEARRLALKGIALAGIRRTEEAAAAFDDFASRFPEHTFCETARYYAALLRIHMGQSALALQQLRSCNLDGLPPAYRARVKRDVQWLSKKLKRPQARVEHYF